MSPDTQVVLACVGCFVCGMLIGTVAGSLIAGLDHRLAAKIRALKKAGGWSWPPRG